VVEPLVVSEARREWLETLRAESTKAGAVLIYDEIKTAFRMAVGGVAEKSGVHPDLMVLGKAMANGFPLAAVGGSRDVMDAVSRTWISSTLATELVALAAARAVLGVFARENVCAHLHRIGTRLLHGLHELQRRHAGLVTGVGGVAEMSFLHYISDDVSQAVAIGCAERGLLFKRTAYNFVSLAHDDRAVDAAVETLGAVLSEVSARLGAPGT
jgi:glutamate-1-semialdehyde 2,1-aminomutase